MTNHPNDVDSGLTPPTLRMRDELKAAVDIALPQTPGQFGARLIKEKWGTDIDPQTTMLVTLDYNYKGRPAQDGIHQGQVANSQSLLQALLANYQTVGDGRFAETAFGLYTPPDIGPSIRIVQNVDEFADHGSGNHQTYEGIYRQTVPQTYGPLTQITLNPADFKKWIWALGLQDLYKAYLDQAWPTDEVLFAAEPYALRTSVKAAFVMSTWLQSRERCLTQKGLELAMQAAGLPSDQAWEALTIEPLQAPTRNAPGIEASRLKLYRYVAKDIWAFHDRFSTRILLYVPGNSSPVHEFTDISQLRQWIVAQGKVAETKQALASHFAEDDRDDGTFHAGVLTALDGMAIYPQKHRLTKEAGFFNDDGFWDPAHFIGFDDPVDGMDPFAQLVSTMKQAERASIKTIRDNAQVNRDNLSAVVEPVVQWVNRFGPLALFVPGAEGLLALAGLIDAGYGLNQAINGKTSSERAQGLTRTVFGVLNALPLIGVAATAKSEASDIGASLNVDNEPGESSPTPSTAPSPDPLVSVPTVQGGLLKPGRLALLRGIGAPVAGFSDEVLAQIGKVVAVDDDMLRLMQNGRSPSPLMADTISRFEIDQQLAHVDTSQPRRSELFNTRYEALQHSEHEWVRLFQQEYPGLPKSTIEQMLDRYGVDIQAPPDATEAMQVFRRLDGKAGQYRQHVRLNRAYEGLYLRSVDNTESEVLALHSLKNLPGWPQGIRIEVLDQSATGQVLDRSGALDAADVRRLIKVGNRYQHQVLQTDFYQALLGVLTDEERTALHLTSLDPANELRLSISDHALSRSELMLGLGRMDSGLPFEAQGLRGGGFPGTPQAEALTHEMMRLQLKELYPEFSNVETDDLLHRVGGGAQAHIDGLKQQFQQLNTDLSGWIDQAADDVEEMDIDFLVAGDVGAQGMNPMQIAAFNVQLLNDAIRYERTSRSELVDELIAIWRKRSPQQDSSYSGHHLSGFRLDMAYEDYHRLPLLNVRLNDVTELSMLSFHLTERESLNGFLESFPNLRILDMQGVDLRLADADGNLESILPSTIAQLQHLTSLNLRSTQLTFEQNTAAQLSQLVNLQSLDLSDNPLGVPPVVLGMDQLRSLKLNDTGIATCPVGIMEQPYMTTLDLSNNQIHRVPQAVLNQAIARDRVLLWNNPLTDEDTLQRLVTHREQTGINLWLSAPGPGYSDPATWLNGVEAAQRNVRLEVWRRLALRPGGGRFLGSMNTLSLTADFQVNYLDLQARVWRLLTDVDASDELWARLTLNPPMPAGAFDNPFAVFTALENRAQLLALGQPIPIQR